MFSNVILIAFMTHGDIAVVAAEEDLAALGDDVAVRVDAGVDGRLAAAVADGLDLGDGVRQLEQPQAAGEQARAEVRPQAEAEHGQIFPVDQLAQLIDLFAGQKLALVHDDDVDIGPRGIERADVCRRPGWPRTRWSGRCGF